MEEEGMEGRVHMCACAHVRVLDRKVMILRQQGVPLADSRSTHDNETTTPLSTSHAHAIHHISWA